MLLAFGTVVRRTSSEARVADASPSKYSNLERRLRAPSYVFFRTMGRGDREIERERLPIDPSKLRVTSAWRGSAPTLVSSRRTHGWSFPLTYFKLCTIRTFEEEGYRQEQGSRAKSCVYTFYSGFGARGGTRPPRPACALPGRKIHGVGLTRGPLRTRKTYRSTIK